MLLEGTWDYQSQTVAPPPSGAMRTNGIDTIMWLHRVDGDGIDRSIEFALAPDVPFEVLVRDSQAHSRKWEVTAVVEETDYATLTLGAATGSTTPPNQNADVLVQWLSGLENPPTPDQEARLAQAVIQKATRILVMAEAPLGSWGEPTEFGMATVRPDYQIRELLYGMRGTVDLDVAAVAALVDADMVIRNGLQLDPASVPDIRKTDIARVIDAAADWIVTDVNVAFGVA